MDIEKSIEAILISAISAGVNHVFAMTDEKILIEFDHEGFYKYLKDWYGEDIANIVYMICEKYDIEWILASLSNKGVI